SQRRSPRLRRDRSRACRRAFVTTGLAALAVLPGASARGQVDGTWVVDADGSWSVGTNWSSSPNFPSSSGTASFAVLSNSTNARTITLDTNVTLSAIVFDTPFVQTVGNNGTLTSTLTLGGPASLIVNDGPPGTPSIFPAGHALFPRLG